ncbi:MAG: DEAD/DEAH box helicase [Pseudomonadales bacterium]|jgi:non-specific serine/threonine protein kinase|nr:DEAD/DEAH box helicase [Gammaproteobacteria bacterium]MBK9668208.1 DEAD/DEAH box helicase [Gammaproteobacteria bacterium]MBP6052096.1 DEAD/DEAH box helicase [Pseudomonadales bacterium]MBP6229675.1 DEAD/DEAH box helicase [Pseudomonadales bacterium]
MSFAVQLTPRGNLRFGAEPDAPLLSDALADRLAATFARGAGHGLLHLGAAEVTTALPPLWAFWRDFAARFVTALTATPEGGEIAVAAPDALALETLCLDAPPMRGAEYLAPETLAALWAEIEAAAKEELTACGGSLADFLKSKHPAWNLVGRVHFNLAENRKDAECPFAFLATYTSRMSAHGKAQHLPLSQALAEFSGGRKKAQLLSLLVPVQKAADNCPWLADMVDEGDIYHPLRWGVEEAVRFLEDVPHLQGAGIVVRMPRNWAADRPARPKVSATVGDRNPSLLGMDSLLDFRMEVTLDGEPLTPAEIESLLAASTGLHWIRGQWVELDRDRLSQLIARFQGIENAAVDGLPFDQAMRLLAGTALDDAVPADPDWSEIVAGDWLAGMLRGLRSPEGLAAVTPGPALKASLRPYQQAGVRWLHLLASMGLGACLADDMGLGKTIQVLALLLTLQRTRPSLLVAPASLLANWQEEAERFTPTLRCLIAHPSAMAQEELRALDAERLAGIDLVITSYATLMRLPNLLALRWHLAVADEAQALKNPSAKQTKAVKQLQAMARIALTGTPVENRIADLWSIFDFTHPGLLGSRKAFAGLTKNMAQHHHFGPLRTLVSPYILRRLKSDKRIIDDLPDKTEMTAWCALSSVQAALYQRAVKELAAKLETAEGIERKGLVLAFLMRFKQICNHPSQWLGDGTWKAEHSGKFGRLAEIAETIAAKQEKMLVFTQFREVTAPLAAFLGNIFGREGLVLHGGTPVGKRRELVKRFQEDEQCPFFVLSLKAGGTGLNLTAASHVIHFDRWWNPAVENQATDRAWRIGQHRNVLAHKFVCRGTIEERIDEMIRSKQQLAQNLLEGGAEINLTTMSDAELLDLIRLDIHSIGE